jgi:uncharacterized membrane protein
MPLIRYFTPLVMGPIHASLVYMFLRRIRGQQIQLGDLFLGFNVALVPLVIGAVLVAALVTVGFVLCILPGIYLAVAYMFVMPLIIDKKLDFWPAMEVSRQVVHKQWWSMFLFALVMVLIACAGALLCGVGLVIAGPLIIAAMTYVYEDIFGDRSAPAVIVPPATGGGEVTA